MSSPVNQEAVNYEAQQYGTHPATVPQYSQNVYSSFTAQSPPTGHIVQAGSPIVNTTYSQPMWTVAVPQSYLLNFYEAFLQGKPKALGILVIIVAILEIGLGVALFFLSSYSIAFYSFISFWGPFFYIISGSLTVAAQPKPSICLIQGSLAMNIISCLCSLSAAIINACDLVFNQCIYMSSSSERCLLYYKYGIVIMALLLTANVLLFFVTLSTSIFGCISMSHLNSTFPQQFVIRNDAAFATNPGSIPMTIATYGQPTGAPQPLLANNNRAKPTNY